MAIDIPFLKIAEEAFNPFRPESGTEHMAPLLYALVRMVRPATIVEVGSGYSTLFLLRALADNAGDAEDEARLLREKSRALFPFQQTAADIDKETREDWYAAGGKACGVDPSFYSTPYVPRLYSFEERPEGHPYSQKMKQAVSQIGHASLFTLIHGKFSVNAIPHQIDFAWNDSHDYENFFDALWPRLNPSGGVIVFHNVATSTGSWKAIEWIKDQRLAQKDLEAVILQEPHKLRQSGCAILRRTSSYRPPLITDFTTVMGNLRRFLRKGD